MKEKKLVVIVGPTGVGKTALAIRLARHYHTEIISADSRQIYQEMTIGTAKPSDSELKEVKHHFIDTLPVGTAYDAGQFGRDALLLIHRLFQFQDVVVMCGGSGLYVKAVCEGFDELPVVPPAIRENLVSEFRTNGISWLQDQLRQLDPEYFLLVDQQNPHRLIRALELNLASGMKMAVLRKSRKLAHDFLIVKIGLDIERTELFRRIDSRMDTMIEAGLFEEAERLHGMKNLNALQTVGYQEIFGFFEGSYDRAEAVRLLKRNSRHYAKRQLTWFKKDHEVKWFDPEQLPEVIQHIDADVVDPQKETHS